MVQKELEKSPHWDERKDIDYFLEEGFPFDEGFPHQPIGRQFTVKTRSSAEFSGCLVDLRRQYKSEGPEWLTHEGENIKPQVVIAWSEEETERVDL